MFVIGLLDRKTELVAVGLANSIINLFGIGFFIGLNGALGTFASQSIGNGSIELSGVYLWRGRLISGLAFLLLSPIFFFSGPILVYLGQEAEVSRLAGNLIFFSAPAIFMEAQIDLEKVFLTSLGRSDIAMYSQIFSPIVQAFACYSLVIIMDLGVFGIALATLINNLTVYYVQNR